MYYFAKVVDHGGYTSAAKALGVPVSSLSRRVSGLEAQLGVRLLNRSTRGISMSEAGQTFYRHCVAVVAEAFAAKESMDQTRAEPHGLVRLSCPIQLLQVDVSAVIGRYMRDHPLVRISVDATNRSVNVVDEGFDLALRVRMPPLGDSDLVVRTLVEAELILVGSAWLFAQHERPATLDAVTRLPTLSWAHGGDRQIWQFIQPDGQVLRLSHLPRLLTDDMRTLHHAALEGLGLAYLPRSMVAADLAAGRLEQVLPELALPQIVHAVYPSRRGLVPAVRGLIDALAAHFEADPGGHRRPARHEQG
ncbi:LysR family transcriptional regulator [Scleromatobacter humisilvae]|uniref:LysR family transcriptional regulator n=1 Tax=Scleromatobacter humisilvae TaxID=2897159 RepID=A0A9X2C4J6_9BURK|nr:LysR family transcriptional regulator [Scleromatobacter humisilvae]MCK9689750.1 LysR family transcriptional regulator [Scleromatobacter humisilvae]